MKRKGFTLIELMIVMGIIVVLIALVTFGFRSMNNSAKAKATGIKLASQAAMTAEARGGLKNAIPVRFYFLDATTTRDLNTPPFNSSDPNVNPDINFWNCWTRQPAPPGRPASEGKADPIIAPGRVEDGSVDRTGHAAIKNTIIALDRIYSLGTNRASLGKLAAGSTVRMPYPIVSPIPHPDVQVPLDEWGNPMIFVPGSGMYAKDADGNTITIKSATEQPFFASAGADGDFQTNDDNIYSF